MSKNFELMVRSGSGALLSAPGDERARPAPARRFRPEVCHDKELLPFVHRLFLAPGSRHVPRSIMFASVEASGQSASLCVRVAKAVASAQAATVCIVDVNRSRSSMRRALAVPQEQGVAARPEQRSSHFMPVEVEPGLWFLPAERTTREAGGGVAPGDVAVMMRELRESFDFVLADIGPIGCASAVAQCADGVVLVVTANVTRRAVALKATQDFVAAGGRLLGAVLTERTFPIPEGIYRRL